MGAAIIRGFHASAVAVADLEALVRDIPAQLKQHVPAKYMSPNFEIIKFHAWNALKGRYSPKLARAKSGISLSRTILCKGTFTARC